MDTETEKCHLVWSEERCLIRRIAQCDIRHARLPLQYIIRRPATAQCTVIAFWVYKKIVDYIFDSDFEGRCCCCCFNGLLLMCILSLNHSCIRMSTKKKTSCFVPLRSAVGILNWFAQRRRRLREQCVYAGMLRHAHFLHKLMLRAFNHSRRCKIQNNTQ